MAAREGFRPERLAALRPNLDLPCDRPCGRISQSEDPRLLCTPPFGGFEVVHVEDLVLRMTVTVLANVTVSKENVFTHVPKPS